MKKKLAETILDDYEMSKKEAQNIPKPKKKK